jgi:N-acetylneuraminic acid mutarotase
MEATVKTYLTFGILILCALLVISVANLTAEENWAQKADMPTQRSYFSTCVVNGKIYAIGGEIDGFGDLVVSTVEMYDPKTDTWTQKADMPTSRITSTCVVDGKIYAIGGEKTHKRRIGPGWGHDLIDLSTVEMYDPATDTWTQKSDMPTPRSASTCVVDGKIYAIGGTAANRKQWRLDTVEVYDPATDTWAKAKKMNHVRSGAAISVVDGRIYVMGGTGWPQIPFHPGPFLSSMEVYNPKTNQWREIGDMPAAKSSHTASVINGKIYVIGEFFRGNGRDIKYFKTIEIYHPETGRWTQKPDMPVSKFGHAAEVINGKIYILTGADPDDAPFATIEVYAPEGFPQSVDPTGKLLKTWGTLKNIQ